MKRYTTALLVLLISTGIRLHAQDTLLIPTATVYDAPLDKISVGAGIGYEYGGLGANAIYYPHKNIGVFGGVGWYYVGMGYTGGIKLRAFIQAPSVTIIPFLEGMYGTNTLVYYRDNSQYNKLFSAFSVGGGIDIRPAKSKLGFISIALYVPFRDPNMKTYTNRNIEFFYGVVPTNKQYFINASIGYKFILWK